ncbi:MAG: M20 family metallo-hydrolase [Thermodesulfobacteriota bacterium]
MDETWARVAGRIEGYTDELVRLQTELVSVPALGPDNGGGGELDKALVLAKWIGVLGPEEMFRVDAPDGRAAAGVRPNLVAVFQGRGRGRAWVLSHLDIVPPGDPGLWDSDPFVLRREDDRLYGRGAEDNHQGIVASYLAVKALREEAVVPDLDVGLIFVADEETGSKYGLDYLLEKRADLFSPGDLIIVPDGGREDGAMIEVAEKSMCWLKFTVLGRQCHASTPHKGANTLRAAARLITALDQALPAAFAAEDPLFTIPRSTFEPTKKEANVPNVNTIPGSDVFYFDARVLPVYRIEAVEAKAAEVAAEVAAGAGVSVRVERVYQVQAPPATPADSPVVRCLARAVAAVHHREALPHGLGGGTVAAFFRRKGLPAAVWSTIDGTAHSPNEYGRISYQLADAKVMAHVFLGR